MTLTGMTAVRCCFVVLASVGTVAIASNCLAQPQTIDASGQTLYLKSQATRSRMFGLVDLYRIGLYAPEDVSSIDMLRAAQTAKVLRIAILYDGSLPNRIPSNWRHELQPALKMEEFEKLRNAYAGLKPKDEIRITHVPGHGTTVTVSGRPVLTTASHDVMAAFLDLWLGQTPVSEEIKAALANF